METFITLIPALGGLVTAVGAWLKARAEARALLEQLQAARLETKRLARKDDLDALRVVLGDLQKERGALLAQVEALREAVTARDAEIEELREDLISRELEMREERHARLTLQGQVAELVAKNERFMQLLGALREHVRRPSPGVLALMHQVPRMVTEIAALAGNTPGVTPELFDRLRSLETLVLAIPELVQMEDGGRDEGDGG